MDQQGDHYFTLWYGVYKVSTRTLRYVNAGAPAPLVFNSATGDAIDVTELPSTSRPVGMFKDTVFTAGDFVVPPGCRILIYSDGASEIPLDDGRYPSAAEFANLCARLVGSPTASLDELVTELRVQTPTGFFEDDCSLIRLRFD
jgi:sigma-B regulation protein RsbU (phosphoserine phosphatase)